MGTEFLHPYDSIHADYVPIINGRSPKSTNSSESKDEYILLITLKNLLTPNVWDKKQNLGAHYQQAIFQGYASPVFELEFKAWSSEGVKWMVELFNNIRPQYVSGPKLIKPTSFTVEHPMISNIGLDSATFCTDEIKWPEIDSQGFMVSVMKCFHYVEYKVPKYVGKPAAQTPAGEVPKNASPGTKPPMPGGAPKPAPVTITK